ncbi:MAG: enoyl-CoA hydratase/isomerase family protein [Flavobacteriales bacterium]|nr:enoyl-CoA hydratase/isomerase family protein [Flavobacteriales bacterium]
MTGYVNTNTINNNSIVIIEFYHPKGNSLPSSLLDSLERAIYKAGSDKNVKCVLIRSAGDGAFCAGASFDELLDIEDKIVGERFFSGFARVINAIRKIPKFVVGEVQGKAVGGGVGLACAFDYCFATRGASIKLSELSIGIGPFVIAPAVERKIGISGLSELSIDAKNWRDASWALKKGMYSEVFDNKNDMIKTSAELLESLSSYSEEAISEMKKTLWKDTEHWDRRLFENAKISGSLVLSEFTKAALKKIKD